MFSILFPPKCVLCRRLLSGQETDLCHSCRTNTQTFSRTKRTIPFVAQWTAIWYYKDDVRKSIQRFKFHNARSYADIYGRLLAIKLQSGLWENVDMITWVPISFLRRLSRGYDQSKLLAIATGKELGMSSICTLKKIRHTRPQSSLIEAAQRRANVLGAYRVLDPKKIAGKRILLLDDVVTTGATASECAKTLMIAGAQEVRFAAIAATSYDKKSR